MQRTRAKTSGSLPGLIVDPTSATPMFRQLLDGLSEAIRAGQFAPGARLPSTRALAQHLGVSRNTAHLAYTHLIAEGYLEGRQGAGTQVAQALPEHLLGAMAGAGGKLARCRGRRPLARRTKRLLEIYPEGIWATSSASRAFRVTPALDEFPRRIWQRLLLGAWRAGGDDLLDYGWSHGGLRQSIVEYLGAARGVHCTADQVIVVAGAQQGIDLAVRVLVEQRQQAWIEDPGYPAAYGALISAGATPVPIPMDGEGLSVEIGRRRSPKARLAYVTPSHQFPMGVTMSLRRRLELLEWAGEASAWVLEDDYCSEYRYTGRPLAALQGLDRHERVIYLGTFSKVLFPALRLAYLVVPRDLIQPFLVTRFFAARHAPRLEQATLASFIGEGHFGRHLRRMRALYARRQSVLVEAAQSELQGLLDIKASAAGLHMLGRLPLGSDDVDVSQRLASVNIDAAPLSAYTIKQRLPPALILGYTGLSERAIKSSVRKMSAVLRT